MTFATSLDLVTPPACLLLLLQLHITTLSCCWPAWHFLNVASQIKKLITNLTSNLNISNFKDDFAKNAWEDEGGENAVEAGVCFWRRRRTTYKGGTRMVWWAFKLEEKERINPSVPQERFQRLGWQWALVSLQQATLSRATSSSWRTFLGVEKR